MTSPKQISTGNPSNARAPEPLPELPRTKTRTRSPPLQQQPHDVISDQPGGAGDQRKHDSDGTPSRLRRD